jgi:uncharacterized membrane protein YkvA (DUF1232 family)
MSHIDKDYVLQESDKMNASDLDEALSNEGKITEKSKRWEKYKDQIKLLFEMLRDYKKGNYKNTPWRSVAGITFALLYILNPLDLVPDVIPFIGVLDDLSVFTVTLNLIGKDFDNYKLWREGGVED